MTEELLALSSSDLTNALKILSNDYDYMLHLINTNYFSPIFGSVGDHLVRLRRVTVLRDLAEILNSQTDTEIIETQSYSIVPDLDCFVPMNSAATNFINSFVPLARSLNHMDILLQFDSTCIRTEILSSTLKKYTNVVNQYKNRYVVLYPDSLNYYKIVDGKRILRNAISLNEIIRVYPKNKKLVVVTEREKFRFKASNDKTYRINQHNDSTNCRSNNSPRNLGKNQKNLCSETNIIGLWYSTLSHLLNDKNPETHNSIFLFNCMYYSCNLEQRALLDKMNKFWVYEIDRTEANDNKSSESANTIIEKGSDVFYDCEEPEEDALIKKVKEFVGDVYNKNEESPVEVLLKRFLVALNVRLSKDLSNMNGQTSEINKSDHVDCKSEHLDKNFADETFTESLHPVVKVILVILRFVNEEIHSFVTENCQDFEPKICENQVNHPEKELTQDLHAISSNGEGKSEELSDIKTTKCQNSISLSLRTRTVTSELDFSLKLKKTPKKSCLLLKNNSQLKISSEEFEMTVTFPDLKVKNKVKTKGYVTIVYKQKNKKKFPNNSRNMSHTFDENPVNQIKNTYQDTFNKNICNEIEENKKTETISFPISKNLNIVLNIDSTVYEIKSKRQNLRVWRDGHGVLFT